MGIFGTGILDNDDALDTYRPYVANFENDIPIEEIKDDLKELLYVNGEQALDENTMCWLGFAKAQLDTGTVEPVTLEVVNTILDNELDFDLWSEDEKSLDEWKASILHLKRQLERALRSK